MRAGTCLLEIRHHDQRLHGGQLPEQFAHRVGAFGDLAAIDRAVAGDQHLGVDLEEAVAHRGHAHVGRGQAPHRAQRRAGQEGHDRLRDVGQVGRNAVAALNAERAQRGRQRAGLVDQVGPCDLDAAAFGLHALVAEHDRRHARAVRRRCVACHLRGVVQLRAGEPSRAGHRGVGQDLVEGRG
jgi:hypothetical protein